MMIRSQDVQDLDDDDDLDASFKGLLQVSLKFTFTENVFDVNSLKIATFAYSPKLASKPFYYGEMSQTF